MPTVAIMKVARMVGESPDYTIAVVGRALDILEALAGSDVPLGASDVARRAGATKSATYRLLATLEQRGYVVKDPVTAQYRLGTRLAYLGQRSLSTLDLRQVARPLLEDLHQRYHETVNLGVPDGDGGQIVYIDMLESDQGLRMAAHLGGRDAMHCTALGKAILANLPPARREPVLAGPLARRTPATITEPAALRVELEGVRARGLAEDRGENEVGARCVAAPIFDHTGAVVAALSVSAPASRLDDARAAEIATAVRAAADDITRRLGGAMWERGSVGA